MNRNVIAASLLCAVLLSGSQAGTQPLPEGFQQVLPRGAIAAIDNPIYVTAAEAKIGKKSWVIGVEIEGQARAYSLSLLNRHEVVNARLGTTDFAVVW